MVHQTSTNTAGLRQALVDPAITKTAGIATALVDPGTTTPGFSFTRWGEEVQTSGWMGSGEVLRSGLVGSGGSPFVLGRILESI